MRWQPPFIAVGVLLLATHVTNGQSTSIDQTPPTLSFREALVRGRARHVDILIAEERVQRAIARLQQAYATLLPQITGTAFQVRQTRNLEAQGITLPGRDPLVGPFNSFDARFRMTQTLFDFSALQRLRAAKVSRQLSLAEARKATQDALALVAALYVEAKRAADGVNLARALVTRDEQGLRLAAQQYRLGTGSALEIKQAEAQLAQDRHRWEIAQVQTLERRLDLAAALGIPNDHLIHFAGHEVMPDEAAPSPQDIVSAVQQHPDVEAARQRLQQQQAEHAAVRAGAIPALSVNADYGTSGRTPDSGDSTYAFGAQLSVPILEGGRRQAQAKETLSQFRESRERLADVEQHIEAKALSARQTVTQAAMRVRATEADLSVATKSLALATHRLATGLGSQWEVTQAMTQHALASDQREEAMAAYQMAQVRLAHALGRMERLIPTP